MIYSKDIKPLSNEELVVKLMNLKKEYMNLRFQKKLDGINPSQIKKVKKNIARVKTRLSEVRKEK